VAEHRVVYGPPRGYRHDISSRDDESQLTLALSGAAAAASAKPADNTIDQHQGELASGLVRFNAGLGGCATRTSTRASWLAFGCVKGC